MARNILKQEQKFKSQNDTFEKLRTILKHDVKVKDHLLLYIKEKGITVM